MVLNYIWIAFFVIAFVFAIIGLAMGDATIFQKIVDSTFDSSKNAFEISLGLTGVLALWLGIMKIGEKAGVVNVLARALSPVFTKLFPDIPKNHPVMGSIFMNIASNMLGLDNAATPTGLKAMAQMQELNQKKDTATNPMIMFLVLNTSGLTIIPTTILAFRASYGAAQPTDVFILWEKKGDSYVINTVFSTLGQAGHNKLYVDGKLVEQADSATFTQFFVRDISDDGKTIVGLNVAGSGGFNPAFIRDGELIQLFNCGEEDNGEEEESEGQEETNFNGGTILSIDGEGNMYGYYTDAAGMVNPFIFTNDNKLIFVDEIYTCAGGGKKFTQTETDLYPAMCCSNDGKVIAGGGLGSDPRIGSYNYPVVKYESNVNAVKNIENIRNHVSISYAGGNLVYINGEYTSAKVYAANGALVATVAQGTPANLAGKAAGTYIVKVETAKGEKTFKVVK
jgi:spore maturation protein SpmA